MKMFRNCIVRKPCKALVDGITSGLYPGKPDYELACKQHEHYIECLKQCGVQVEVLPPLEEYPDSVFVEDPAVVTRSCAIIANPGAASRNGDRFSKPLFFGAKDSENWEKTGSCSRFSEAHPI